MITLHQYPPAWGLSSLSPFCIKVELLLKMANLSYKVKFEINPKKGPKGKMPFITDREKKVADSHFISKYLETEYGANFGDLCPHQISLVRMVEQSLYFSLLYSRWVDTTGWEVVAAEFKKLFPLKTGGVFLGLIRRQLIKQANSQGVGSHSKQEVYRIALEELNALHDSLGDAPFYGGSNPNTTDATIYSFLATIYRQPIDSPMKEFISEKQSLIQYMEAMQNRFGI